MSAVLWAGGVAVISHTTAARLLRLDIKAGGVHLTVPRNVGLRSNVVTVHHGEIGRADRVAADGIPCTSATCTLVDCAALVDGETLETAFEQSRRMGLTSVRAIRAQLGPGRAGSAQLRAVLQHAEARPRESRLEVKLARLLRSSRLPQPVVQSAIGNFPVDYAWPVFMVVCECDGFEWHGDRLRWKNDRRRVAAIEAAGWRVVHVTWEDVTQRPSQTLDRLALALRRAA